MKEALHKDIISKKQKIAEVKNALKENFIGLDNVIDEVMNLVSSWYLFPQAQFRPLVINLWGMTGSGKTALVKKLVELLDHKKLYVQMDMGEFESDSAAWLKNTLTGELEFFHEQQAIICLDEFQLARTIDSTGEEMGKDKLRVVWDLVDSGKISYIPNNSSFYIKRADLCILNLLRAAERGVVITNGVVTEEEEAFIRIFNDFYFENNGRNGKEMDKDYFLSKDFIEGVFYLFSDDNVVQKTIEDEVSKSDLNNLVDLIIKGLRTRTASRELDLSKSIIFILGNLDEAYYMSHSVNPDISADELHESTLKINITNIKSALKNRFRFEQIARLGNNHIIYRAFKNSHFEELIKRQLGHIACFVKSQLGFDIIFHSSVYSIIYREGVFPAQGTRPVFTTIKNLVESWISRLAVEYIEKNLPVSSIEWSFCDEKYVFVFKDSANNILNIYEEKVNLKIDVLRKTSNKNQQAHTAVHESGHAILAALTLRIVPSLIVSKTAGDNCEGFCMINFPEGIFTREVLMKDIIISLGGYIAEKIVFGRENTSSGVYEDLEHASSLANRAIKTYAMGSDPIHIAVYSKENNDKFFIEEKYRQEAMQLIYECEREAENILEKNKLLLLKMADFLTNNSRMEEAQIAGMIKEFSAEPWVKVDGFKRKDEYFSFHSQITDQLHEFKNTVHSIKERF
jgi:cell division protease FtsH